VASRSLDELVTIFSNDNSQYIRNVYYGLQRLKAIEIARSQEIELSKRYPLDIRGLRRLALIDAFLASHCIDGGKQEEARSLSEESIDCWESCLALAPDDLEIQRRLLEATVGILSVPCDRENDHLYERSNARAIAMLERLRASHEVPVGEVFKLSRYHRLRANDLILRGESKRARKELEEDLDVVRSVPVAETAFRGFVLSAALTLAALGQWSGEFTRPRSPIHSEPTNIDIDGLERGLAELTARRIGWLPSIVKSPWLIPEDLPTEAWTDRVISSIQSDTSKFGLDRIRIPAIGWLMMHPAASTLTRQRRVGKLGDASRIADQLLALATRLTQSYPDQAAAYMLLSEGCVQRAKMAYRMSDEPVIEWERKALDAALHAVTLEPENDEAHGLVKNRCARLNKLASK